MNAPASPVGTDTGLAVDRERAFETVDHASALAAAALIAGFGVLGIAGMALARLRPEVVSWGAARLPDLWGLPAAVLLVTSGLTVAWAAHCARLRRHRIALGMLVATTVLAVAFLGAVFGQTRTLLERGLGWGAAFVPATSVAAGATGGMEGAVEAEPVEPPRGDATTTPLAPQGPAGLRDPSGTGETGGSAAPVPPYGGLFFGMVHMGSLVQVTWVLLGLVAVLWNLGRIRARGLDAQRVMALEALARLWQPVVAFGVLAFVLLHVAG